MLGCYTFLYQLEILKKQQKYQNSKISHFHRHCLHRSEAEIQRYFPLFIYVRCQLLPMYVSYPQRLCCSSVVESPSLCRETVGPMPCTEVQVEVYVQRGKWSFFPLCFYKHKDHRHLLSCVQASSAILKIMVHLSSSCINVCERHHGSHKSE